MLKIQIVRGGRVLFEAPLVTPPTVKERHRRAIDEELQGLSEDFSSISNLLDTLANETRLRMLADMVQESRRFSDFMREMHLNPKIVSENLNRMLNQNLIQRRQKRRYMISPLGWGSLLTMCVVLRRVRGELQTKGGERGNELV
ncbi:MAG: winged helix-turn-helix domain-containing protein [Candidatus Bathyarchaeia archaeon]